jgi:hypothetical protein
MKKRNGKKKEKYLKLNVYKKSTKCTYVCIVNTDKDCDLYMIDPSSSQGGRPTTNKTATVLTTAKIWS